METVSEQLVIANEVEKLNGYRKGSPEVGSQHGAASNSTCFQTGINMWSSKSFRIVAEQRDLLIATFSLIHIV